MKGKIGFVVCVCALILVSVSVSAKFEIEVPEGAVTFDSLGFPEKNDMDALKFNRSFTLRFAEPCDVRIVLHTYRYIGCRNIVYINEIFTHSGYIPSGYQVETIDIPGILIKTGENTIRMEFIDHSRYNKFSEYALIVAPKSYVVSTDAPEIVSPTKTPVYSPTPSPTIPTPATTQIEIQGFSIQDIQKSSETAPEINIEPIEEQMLPNTTVLLSGTASIDSGIESVTVNGQYVGTDYWSVPIDLALGDNNIVIVATGNDGSTTIEKVKLTAAIPESESKRSSHVPYFVAFIGAIATIVAAIIIARYTKKEK